MYTYNSSDLDKAIAAARGVFVPWGNANSYNKKQREKDIAAAKRIQENARKSWACDKIKKVIFNDPATIVYWADGSKTIVKCGPHDTFDPEKGLAIAWMKHSLCNDLTFHAVLKKFLPKEKPQVLEPTTDPCDGETCSLDQYLKER